MEGPPKCRVLVRKDDASKEYEIETVPAPKDLLEELEKRGARMPFGCRAGSCGACRVIVHEGLELLSSKDIIEEDTLERCGADGRFRLACRACLKPGLQARIVVEVPPEESDTPY